jgi:hypothetical protein
MSAETIIRNLLRADAGAGGVNTLLTGGIWAYEIDLGRTGLSFDVRPEAYSATTGRLLPCCIVKMRAELPDGGMMDADQQWQSTRQIVELWFYDDGAFSTIRAARLRSYFVLQEVQVAASAGEREIAWINLAGDIDLERDPDDLDNAARLRQDWQVVSALHT